jgi:hypothetical protein
MTNEQYSPATQAVSDAANQVYWDWCEMCPASAETIAAAALRAAANEVYSLLNVPASTTEPEMVTGMRTAYVQYHSFLHKIAKELEETK